MRVVDSGEKREAKTLNEIWLGRYSFFRSIKRNIDKETILDLLSIVQYESNRVKAAEEIGIDDKGASFEMLFDYVLDSLGIPFDKDIREPYYELFYSDLVDAKPTDFNAELALRRLLCLKN